MTQANDSILGAGATALICTTCGVERTRDEFYRASGPKARRDGRESRCKYCSRKRCRRDRLKHLDARLATGRSYEAEHRKERRKARENLRREAITAYGAKCSCCGESEMVFLAIDHLNGGGARQRKEISNHTYRWLKKLGYPSGFQVLCHNCNWAKHIGSCPHKVLR